MKRVLDFLKQEKEAAVECLSRYLRYPSVSADRQYRDAVRECAGFTADRMRDAGLETEIVETGNHPIVVGRSPRVDGPHLLVYGHYDVQPPDPLDLWHSPPFEPAIRDGNIVARGSSDDKGQILAHLLALRAFAKTGVPLGCNVTVIVEGEEEIGSEELVKWMAREFGPGQYDGVVLSDNQQLDAGQPAICYSLRGIAYFEITLEGPNRDLHSGTYGGIVPNPATALAQILGGMKDRDGRILIPGFYDDVEPIQDWEREAFAKLPFNEEALAKEYGLDSLPGESGYSTLERKWCRPTLDVNGLCSGYMGEGAKTVIPARAVGKVSMRLVPRQEPDDIENKMRRYVEAQCPEGIRATVRHFHMSPPVTIGTDNPVIQAGMAAFRAGFEAEPVFIRDGASIPIVSLFDTVLQAPIVMLGFGRPDDNLHSPNEKFNLEDFQRAQITSAHFLRAFAESVKPGGGTASR